MEEKLKTVRETATELGLVESTVRKMIDSGKIQAVKVGGWRIMVDQAEIERVKELLNKIEPVDPILPGRPTPPDRIK